MVCGLGLRFIRLEERASERKDSNFALAPLMSTPLLWKSMRHRYEKLAHDAQARLMNEQRVRYIG